MRYLIILVVGLFQFAVATAQNCTANYSFESNMLTYEFTDLSSSSDGTPINSWSWDFGDGSTSDQQNPIHTFPQAEDYNVCLTVTTQGGCTSTQFCLEIEICELNINTVLGNCDANNNIPLDITISDPYDEAKEIDVFIDGVLFPGSPFDIEDTDPVIISTDIPGDGLMHTVTAQSLDVGTCMATDSFSVPDCGSNCFLSSMNVDIANPIIHNVNVGDNFFDPANLTIEVGDIVEWIWIGNGHTSTSDANSGPDSWTTSELDAPSTFQHKFQTVGTHNYYCLPHGGPGGSGMSGVVISNCPNGTTDIDYEINFNTSIADPMGYNIYINGNLTSGSPYNYSGTGPNSLVLSLPGDGLMKTIMIEDIADPSCTISRDATTPDCGSAPSCSLTLSAMQSGSCSNNEVPYDITVSDINGGNSFTVTVDGNAVPGSPFNYNSSGSTVLTINVPGDGMSHSIEVTDSDDANCTDNLSVTTPDCSVPCTITGIQITTGQAALHTVDVVDFDFQPSSISITLGDTVQFVWTGSVEHTTTSDATSGPDSWDSGLLGNGATFITPILSVGNHPYYCIPHGSPGGVGMSGNISVNPDCNNGMVSATINFTASGTGFSGYNVLVDGSPDPGNPYPYDASGNNSVNVLLPGDGMSHSIMIQDVDNPSCSGSTNYTTTDCNNTAPCEVTVSATVNGGCDNNNEVPVDLTITNINSGSQFDVLLNGAAVPGSPFDYNGSGTTQITINVPGNGQSQTIEVIDANDPSCSNTTNITTPDCTIPCSISNMQITAGQAALHTVDVVDFDFQPANLSITDGDTVQFVWTGSVQHTATSDATSGPNSWDSGLLGNGATFTAPILSIGNHPYYCVPHGAPGGVGMSGTITVNPDCNNGMVSANLTFSSSGTGANGYNILVDGTPDPGNPHSYDASGNNSVSILIPGDGQAHTIEVHDVSAPSCSNSINYTTTDCNQTAPCEITISQSVNGGCNNNEIAVDLTITNINSGSQFDLLLDGGTVPGSPFDYNASGTTQLTINVPGDGQSHTIEAIDTGDPSCSGSTSLTTQDCSIPCSINNLQASGSQAALHTVEVADFEFIPQNIAITQGDTIEFLWTGAVQHTATSDAPSGPDSWDSGLLGNGATYKAPVLSIGNHPYYCIPHGAPGGVGMSGNITVNPDCSNGMVSTTITFSSSGTGPNGYNILVDGNPDPGNPYSYTASGENSVVVLLPGDGLSHNISIQDVDETTCNASINYTTADCNNTAPCDLSITSAIGGPCDSNDEVPVDLTVINVNSGPQFNLYLNGNLVSGSPFNYNSSGSTNVTINVPGNGQSHNIEVVDINDSSCSATTTVNAPDCTNNNCSINNLILTSDEPVKHIVEVKDFSFAPVNLNVTVGDTVLFVWTGQVAHTTTSDATSGPDSWDSGLLGNGAEFEIIIQSPGSHPYYCIPHGGPGGVGMAGEITASDNCTNGNVAVNIHFESDRTAFDSYNILIDGAISGNSPYNYSPSGVNNKSIGMSGDGQNHNIKIQDVAIPSCSANENITVANCNGPACQLALDVLNISSCLPNDSVTVDLSIEGLQNSSGGFNIYVNSSKYNSIPYPQPVTGDTTITITLKGDGNQKDIEVRDVDQSNCSSNKMIQLPVCGNICVLNQLMVNSTNGAIHIVEVKDFEFQPENIQIIQGDSVKFVWKGDIEHTTTSDATSGPDSWDSGLLGKGAIYKVNPAAEGSHPYYCTPHGGPGGIGMSGNIAVLAQCDGDSALISASFNAQNASGGYNVFLDGDQINDTLLSYDNSNGRNSFIIKILGDGLLHTLTIQDSNTSFCAISKSFTAPQCGAPCLVKEFKINQGSDINHIIAVRDFDFAPEQKTVNIGETVRFLWTGNIPHSTTSDAISGPDSWNSGILGNGAIYNIQLQTPGEHPYYCIPHGGPGGIGMAANITAVENCLNGMDKIQIEFRVRGGSPSGYNVFIDGNLHPSSPFVYDDPQGVNKEILYLMGDGNMHNVTIQDLDVPFCAFTQAVQIKDCNTACLFEQLNVNIGIPTFDTVDVADFEFLPKEITVESGDTIIFDFVGDIAHTVTSDATSGNTVFNSGLLDNGDIYKLSIEEEGQHPYYCIPHGGPGGIGMAGNIEVVSECEDDSLELMISFKVTGQSTGYNVYVNGNLTDDSPIFYNMGTDQQYVLSLPANGQLVNLKLEDIQQSSCSISTNINMPDCDDPCYPYRAQFNADINPALLQVQFNDRSDFEGNVNYHWSFGDGNISNEENPVHSYTRVGTYEACLVIKAEDGSCADTVCQELVVGQIACEGDFSITNNGLKVTLNAAAQTNSPNISYSWDFGDGANGQGKNIDHEYAELGVYEICLDIQADTCMITVCKEIDLSDSCLLLQSGFQAMVQGNDRSVTFDNQSRGEYTYRLWGFGDGNTSTEENPTHTYASDGIYNVCLVLRNEETGCSDYYCFEVEVGNVATTQPVQDKKWVLYPNPIAQSQSTFYIHRKSAQYSSAIRSLELIDAYGKTIFKEEYANSVNEELRTVELKNNLPAGFYLLRINSVDGDELHKLIIQ